jgi:lipoprotein signal peptidase
MSSHTPIGNRTKILKLFILFVALILVDQLSKGLISRPILNSGFFLGSLEWASPFYRVFCTIALLGISVIVITLIQFLTITLYPSLSVALTILEAGIVGNGIDKLRFESVRDFIPLTIFSPPLVLNIADFFLWIGLFSLLVMIWKNPQKIWPKKNDRNRLLAFPATQLRMIFVLFLITGLVGIANFVLVLAYLESNQIPFHFRELITCFGLFLLITWLIIFIFGVAWSNRIYGPFRAIERYLRMRQTQQGIEVKFRASDENECVREIISLLKKDDSQ